MLLHWCDICHAPVLSETCACGAVTRKVQVTPPGDIRPAFPADVSLINRIYSAHFGAPLIPEGHVVLLNKVPDTDRMEEIIMGGAVVGAIRYNPSDRAWEPLPRQESALYLTPLLRFVVVDPGAVASIRDEGASVLAPGLISIHPSVRSADEVFILDPEGRVAGVGRARADAIDAASMTRGQVVRTRKNARSTCIPGPSTWDAVVGANAKVLEEAEAEAIGFIRNVSSNYAGQATVSYSGGKDSLATLILVLKAIGNVPLLFADTGFEFPETYQNVSDVAAQYGLPVVRSDGKSRFWEAYDRHGPPAVNHRWCCSACKLLPLKETIGETWGGCLSFIGQRRYESFRRKESSRVFRNGIVTNQTSAAPIQNWTALHVWLYLFREDAPFNPLYAKRLDRIGCYLCPSSDVAVLEDIKKSYPDLWDTWELKLKTWREDHGLPAAWIDEMRWRIKEGVADEADSNC